MLRARIGIQSEAVLELGSFKKDEIIYKIHDARLFAHPDMINNVNNNFRIIDIIFEYDKKSINDNFIRSLNIIDVFFDSISYIGYSSVKLIEYYSLCPLETKVGEIFEILIPQYSINKQQNSIALDSIKKVNITDSNKNAIRLLRNALNSNSNEERYISLYSALEWLAEKNTQQTIMHTCEECGYEKNTGRKATGNYLTSMFKQYGKSSSEAKKYNSFRAKIAHGSGTRNQDYLNKVTEYSSYLEEILIQEIDKLVNISQANSGNVIVTSTPYFIHKCQHDTDGLFSLQNSQWVAPIKFTNLKERENKSIMSIGAPLNNKNEPIINPISWPNYQNT